MNSQNNSQYAQSQGLQLLDIATRQLGPIFTIKQLLPLSQELKISQTRLHLLVSLLARSGWIEILKNGTYAVQKSLYVDEISPFAIAAALVEPMAISHWSALAHHGFTTQSPTMIQASTPRKVVTPEMRSGHANSPRGRAIWRTMRAEVEFIHVQMRHFFGHQQIWVNSWQQVEITDPERTVLDLVARSDIFGGMSASLDIFEEIFPRLNIDQLIEYGMQYDSKAVIKRLGWILEQLNVNEDILVPLQRYDVKTYYRLDPKNPAKKFYNARWRVIENLRREDA